MQQVYVDHGAGPPVTAHLPVRPQWTCAACANHWPCHTRRRQLIAEFAGAPVSLGLYLAACLVDAAADLPDRSAGALYNQFLSWLRQHPKP